MTNKAERVPAAAAEEVPEFWVGDVLNRKETTQKLEKYLLSRYQEKSKKKDLFLRSMLNGAWVRPSC